MKKQLPLHKKIQIAMIEKNLSRAYVRKKMHMKKAIFSMALAGDRIKAMHRVAEFVFKSPDLTK